MNPVLHYRPSMPGHKWRASITYPLGKDGHQPWDIDRLLVHYEDSELMDMFDRVAYESEDYWVVCLRS
jgi:3-oxoacyl-[acyl-carrier-protein] synthase III